MSDNTSIQVAIASDASEELVTAFGRLLPQLSSSAPTLDRHALTHILAAPSNTVLIARDAEKGGMIVGALTLVVVPIPTGIRAWMEDVVVDAAARGKGVGEALSRQALRIAEARGARNVDLTSRPSREAANSLYRKLGFTLRATNVYRYALATDE
jgi:ribosomal protein S18 acetylase RimI-like enzyme